MEEYCKGVKGVIFDYGGTIDSGGEHWSEVLYRGWKAAGISAGRDAFREAYVHAERTLAKEKHIMPEDNFLTLLKKKVAIELAYFSEHGGDVLPEDIPALADKVAEYCDATARRFAQAAKEDLIEPLADHHIPMVLVSNFYGNIESVLKEYGLLDYFSEIVESAVVGVRKPDPEIFRLGVKALGVPAGEVLVIGDSYKKDILPALEAGCRAVWIKGKGWTEEEDRQEYPYIVRFLAQLTNCLINKN